MKLSVKCAPFSMAIQLFISDKNSPLAINIPKASVQTKSPDEGEFLYFVIRTRRAGDVQEKPMN